jgi:hypothetical protein
MELVEHESHDHPQRHADIPLIGCAICGHSVQPKEVPDEALFVAENESSPYDYRPSQWLQEAMHAMSQWSQEHAATHSQKEHDEHQQRLLGKPPKGGENR